MDTKPLLALSWLFVVLLAICASLMFVLTSASNIRNYSAAVCIDGQLRAVSAGGQAYLLRDRSGNPMTCASRAASAA